MINYNEDWISNYPMDQHGNPLPEPEPVFKQTLWQRACARLRLVLRSLS
jgi:hypothetical protein